MQSGLSALQAERGDPAAPSVNEFLITCVLKLKLADTPDVDGTTIPIWARGHYIAPVASPRC